MPLLVLLSFAAASAPQASALDFGLAAAGSQPTTDYEMEAVARSGAKDWRFGLDCFSWYGHETTVWQEGWDKKFQLAWEHGITVLPTLSSRCESVAIELPSRSEWEPANSLWERFSKAVVEHYGINGSFWNGKSNPKPVENWEIQNEPNLAERGISGVASGWIYAEFFKRIAESLQAAQGSFFTTHSLVGGLYYGDVKDGASKTPHTFMQEMNASFPAVKPWVYGVAIHPYEFGTTSISDIEADIKEARTDVNANLGLNKPLWITEIGWPVEGHNTGVHEDSLEWQEKDLNSLFNWVKTEATGKNIQALIFYMYRDDAPNESQGPWAHYCGLRSAENPAKKWEEKSFRPAWYAFQSQTGAAKWPVGPTVETTAATNIGANRATINGIINPHGLPTAYHFEYSTVENWYDHWSPGNYVEIGWKEGNISQSRTLTGLKPNTTYHYRIVGVNENEEIGGGGDKSFKTLPAGSKFSTPTSWGSWTTGFTHQYADVNGDGKADELSQNSGGDIQVGWSNSTSFLWASTWIHWPSGYSVRFADVNADGKADIVGENSSGDVQVGWSNGTNGFLSPTSWTTWPSGYSFELADVNGDKRADVVGKNSAGEVKVGLSTGSAFSAPASWGTWPSGYSFELADVNGDGKVDAVGKNSAGEVKVGLSSGTTFAASTAWATWPSGYSIDFADVNLDGKADAVGKNAAGEVKAGLSTGSAFSAPASWGTWPNGYSIDFADVNNDKRADAIGQGPTGDTQVGLSTGSAFSASTAWTSAYSVDFADVTGDGKADAIGRNSSYDIEVGSSNGTSSFSSPTSWALFSTAYSMEFADVNGDGMADMAGKNSSGDLQVALSQGGHFASSSSWDTWPSGYSLEFADVNGDGKADAVGENAAGNVWVSWSSGSAFPGGSSWITWPSGYSFSLADVNGDGKADAVGMNSSGDVKVAWSNGANAFLPPTSWITWPSGYSFSLADVNGDSMADAVGQNAAGEVKVGLSNGEGFNAPIPWAAWPSGYSLDFADVSGDGKVDAIGRNAAGDVKAGLSVTASTAEQLSDLATTEPFNGSSESIANFSAKWSTLGWAAGKGTDTATGWHPAAAYPAVNGAYYNPTVSDTGPGVASVATMAANPGSASNYFSIWLDTPSLASSRSGYELKFAYVSANTYTVTLSKWVAGTQTVLGTKSSYAFANGNSLALVDQGGTVSAWTNTGSGFSQLLSASDSTFSGGNTGLEGAGEATRLTNFKTGPLWWIESPPPPSHYRYMLGTSSGTAIGSWSFALTGMNQPKKMAVGDVTGDGKDDVVSAEEESSGKYRYMLGTSNGNGIASWSTLLAGMNKPDKMAVGDFSGDGKADIIATEEESAGKYRYVLGTSNGSGIASWTTLLTGMSQATFMSVGDVTGDGKADIVAVESEGAGKYRYMLGTSKGTSVTWGSTSLTGMSGPWQMSVGDVTGDGKADIVAVEDAGGGSFRYMRGTSTGSNFSWGTLLTGMSAPYAMGLGDVNGDGKADVVADESEGGGKYRYMFGISTGSGISPWGYALTGLSTQQSTGVGDVTGDGKDDVIGVEAY